MLTVRPYIIAFLMLAALSVAACGNPPEQDIPSAEDDLNRIKKMTISGVRYKVHLLCVRHGCDQGPLVDAISNHIIEHNPLYRHIQYRSESSPAQQLDRVIDDYSHPYGSIDDVLVIANTCHVPASTIASILYEYEIWDKINGD